MTQQTSCNKDNKACNFEDDSRQDLGISNNASNDNDLEDSMNIRGNIGNVNFAKMGISVNLSV